MCVYIIHATETHDSAKLTGACSHMRETPLVLYLGKGLTDEEGHRGAVDPGIVGSGRHASQVVPPLL